MLLTAINHGQRMGKIQWMNLRTIMRVILIDKSKVASPKLGTKSRRCEQNMIGVQFAQERNIFQGKATIWVPTWVKVLA
jgi:hypothetical protein